MNRTTPSGEPQSSHHSAADDSQRPKNDSLRTEDAALHSAPTELADTVSDIASSSDIVFLAEAAHESPEIQDLEFEEPLVISEIVDERTVEVDAGDVVQLEAVDGVESPPVLYLGDEVEPPVRIVGAQTRAAGA